MTVIVLDSGARFEVREGKLFLKEGDSYEHVERIERLIEILEDSESIDVVFKLGSEFIYFEAEWEGIRGEYPVFVIPLLHEFKRFKLSDNKKTLCTLVPTKKFKKEEITNILNNAPFAWSIIDFPSSFGRLIEYFIDPEIFAKNRLEGEDIFDEFQRRLAELRGGVYNVFRCLESESVLSEVNELFDFFSELVERLDDVNDVFNTDAGKIQIFQKILENYEKIIKELWLMIHAVSRLIFNQKLISLQLFINYIDKNYARVYDSIALTTKNLFDVDLFKLGESARRNLQRLIGSGREGRFRNLRNDSPLSHAFKVVDTSLYTVEEVIETLKPVCGVLFDLLESNIRILRKRIKEDLVLQDEIAKIGISTDDAWSYVYQLEDILFTIKKFTPSEVVRRLKHLKNLYLNLFLLLSFFKEVKMEVIR